MADCKSPNWFDELEAAVTEAFEKMTSEELIDSFIAANQQLKGGE